MNGRKGKKGRKGRKGRKGTVHKLEFLLAIGHFPYLPLAPHPPASTDT